MPIQPDRRSFLVAGGITALASTRVLGANDTIRLGVIGAGERMQTLLDRAEKYGASTGNPVQFAAVSDVWAPRREAVRLRSGGRATTHLHYKEVLDQQLDAVLIAAPDHWHVKMATDALAANKDVYLEKPVTHTIEEGAVLTAAVRNSKQILQCGMQQRSWPHFKNAVEIVQSGRLGRVLQVRTYWWQNYQQSFMPKPIDTHDLDWKLWLGSAPDQPFNQDKFFRWRWYWNFGGGAMTDLFTHWIDVVQWAMKSDQPTQAQMLGDNYFFKEWQCPDTIQASFRYPGFDVNYQGMMASSIDDGGIEFRGTDATLKVDRSSMSVYQEGTPTRDNPVLTEKSLKDGTFYHMQNFLECLKSRKEPNAPVETGVAAARAGHIGNYAYLHNGQTPWPPKA